MNLILRPNSDIDTGAFWHFTEFGSGPGRYGKINEVTADDTNGLTVAIPVNTWVTERFGFPAIDISGTITNVTAKARAWGSHHYLSGGKIQLGLRTGGSTYRGSQSDTPPNPATFSFAQSINPKTSLAWTWTDINGLQLEIGLYLYSAGGSTFVPYCSQAWLEVEYEAPPSANKVPLHLFFQGVR